MSHDENDPAPVWLHESYDFKHKEDVESQPLLGSGPLPPGEDSNRSLDGGDKGLYGAVKSPPKDDVDSPAWTKSILGGIGFPIQHRETTTPSEELFRNEDDKDEPQESGHREIAVVTEPTRPTRSCILSAFRLIERSGMVCLGGLFLVVLIDLFSYPVAAYGPLTTTLRIYVAFSCLIFLMVEVNAPIPFLQQLRILQNYISRGFLYTFLGLIVMEESYVDTVKETLATDDAIAVESEFQITWLPFFGDLFAYAVFGFGCLYVLMGLVCLKRVRDHHKELEKLEWERYRRGMEEYRRYNH